MPLFKSYLVYRSIRMLAKAVNAVCICVCCFGGIAYRITMCLKYFSSLQPTSLPRIDPRSQLESQPVILAEKY